MANFGRNDEVIAGENSRISAGTTIKGEIKTPTDIKIDGTFEGKVTSDAKVTIGENAVIKGDIVCNDADLWGQVNGNLYVKDTLSLKDTCVVEGDLHIRRLSVELDAKFNGNCKMITEADFQALTAGDQPAMYDVPEPEEPKYDDSYTVGGPSAGSPFSVPAEEEIPEA